MTIMMRACAIGFFAILATPQGNAETAGKTETLARSPPKGAVHISERKSYRKGSSVVMPHFFPDLGAFDLRGRLTSTIYMHTRSAKRTAVRLSDRTKSERIGYKKVSSLVNFPAFFPGIG